MDIDAFWQLIDGSLEHAPGRAAREHYLEGRLAALAPDGIVAFQAFLDQARDRALTWDLWGAAMRIFGGWCSDDGFEYFRLWLIGRGRMTFERAIAMPDSLATVPAIQRLAGRRRREWDDDEEWPEWETLDYIAARAYRLVTGNDDECGEDFYDAVRSQLAGTVFQRHPDGERWDAADETAAAMKIPELAASFPSMTRSDPSRLGTPGIGSCQASASAAARSCSALPDHLAPIRCAPTAALQARIPRPQPYEHRIVINCPAALNSGG